MGSRMYGTNNENSDTDILCIYNEPYAWPSNYNPIFIPHQFQYTENNVDYIWTTFNQFWLNQRSGDSTINSDILMWGETSVLNFDSKETLNYLYTYKVIKAYLGFANRDLKSFKKEGKMDHVIRSIYTALCLLDKELPSLTVLKWQLDYYKNINLHKTKDIWNSSYLFARNKLNKLFESGDINMYYVPETRDSLLNKYLQSVNIKEFKYD